MNKVLETVIEGIEYTFEKDILVKQRNTEVQSTFTKTQRIKNVKDAFVLLWH